MSPVSHALNATPGWVWPVAGAVLVAFVVMRFAVHDHERFFTLEQRALVGDCWGANCVWRPTHWPQGAVGVWCSTRAWLTGSTNLYLAGLACLVLAGTGVPITRSVPRCGGTVQGGHQWPAAGVEIAGVRVGRGRATVWNCEPVCGRHNRHQSARWSWWYAATQGGPLALVVYGIRNLVGTTLLVWKLAVSAIAREKAQQGHEAGATE